MIAAGLTSCNTCEGSAPVEGDLHVDRQKSEVVLKPSKVWVNLSTVYNETMNV